jgi:hypothetical protein
MQLLLLTWRPSPSTMQLSATGLCIQASYRKDNTTHYTVQPVCTSSTILIGANWFSILVLFVALEITIHLRKSPDSRIVSLSLSSYKSWQSLWQEERRMLSMNQYSIGHIQGAASSLPFSYGNCHIWNYYLRHREPPSPTYTNQPLFGAFEHLIGKMTQFSLLTFAGFVLLYLFDYPDSHILILPFSAFSCNDNHGYTQDNFIQESGESRNRISATIVCDMAPLSFRSAYVGRWSLRSNNHYFHDLLTENRAYTSSNILIAAYWISILELSIAKKMVVTLRIFLSRTQDCPEGISATVTPYMAPRPFQHADIGHWSVLSNML